MCKKVLSVLVALTVFLTAFTYASEKDSLQTVPEKMVEAELLEALNIYTVSDTMESYNTPVKRGVFVDAVMKMAYPGMVDYSEEESYFTDVDEESNYYSSVSAAYSLGLVSGISYRKFAPEDNIKTEHALSLVVKVLGYDILGTQTASMKLGLTREFNSSDSDELAEYNMVMLLYAALDADLMEAEFDGGYEISEDINLLNLVHKVKIEKGIVTANMYTGLSSASDCVDTGEIRIEDTIYKINTPNGEDYLGMDVTAYYKRQRGDVNPEIVYITENKSERKAVFESNDASFENNQYKVELESGVEKTYRISSDSYIIHNQKANYISAGILPENGQIQLIDQNADGIYDVVKVTEYETYFVKSVNHNDYKILTDDGSLSFDEDVICTLDGKDINWNSIDANQVISVVRSKNKTGTIYSAIHASSKTLDGVIEKIWKDKISVNGTIYTLLNGLSVSMDTDGLLCLDFLGRVAYIEGVSSRGYFGYMLKMGKKDGLDDTLKIKLLTEDGSIKVMDVRDNAKLNNEKKSNNEILSLIGSVPQIIKYRLDGQGKIFSLLSEAPGGINKLIYNGTATKFMYRSRSKGLGESKKANGDFVNGTLQYMMDGSTKVFFVSSDVSDEKKFTAGAVSSLKDGAEYSVIAAYAENNLKPCEAIVIDVDAGGEYIYRYNYLYYICDVVRSMDSDGNDRVELTGVFDGNKVTHYVDPERYPGANEILPGDILQIEVSGTNELNVIRYVYRISGVIPDGFTTSDVRVMESDGLRGSISDTALIVLGKITNRIGSTVEVEFIRDGAPERGVFDISAGKYYVFEKGTYKVMDDKSVPFETDSNQVALFHVRSGGTFEIVLINK